MELIKTIVDSLLKVKGHDIVCYDMEHTSPLFDYMIITTVDSARQSDAATSYIKEDLALKGFDVKNVEGKNSAWVLIDCRDVIVHVFTEEERQYYNLEKIYADKKKVDINSLIE